MARKAQWTWEFEVARERLWEFLADTDWVNEHAGLPRIDARFEPVASGGTRKFGSFRVGPVNVAWEELPAVWRVPEFFTVVRRYTRGPLRRFASTTALSAIGPAKTRVVVDIELEAATPLFEPILPLIAAHGKHGANRAFSLAAKLAGRQSASPPQSNGATGALTSPIETGIDPAIAGAIDAFVAGAEDRDLLRMRPYELADSWQLPRREVLRAFLAATRAGRFNLHWSVICPGCRGPTPGIETLESLQRGYHCPACNVPFDAIFDRSVEVTFTAHPLGRAVQEGLFCLASPQRSPHVYAQSAPAAGRSEEVDIVLPVGNYDVNAVGVGVAPFVATGDEAAHHVRAGISGGGVDVPHAVGSGALSFTIANELDRDVVVRIEDGRWPDTIVTAAQVTALQEFRDLFSSEVLAPGLELGIESLAVLFTDLVGSTAMYSRTGDAPAFRVVTDHFEALREVVSRNEGTIVKTIGDAVMAVFTDPGKCFDAALELDTCVRTIVCDGMPLCLRVGFHSGPCIAMRANDRIDYFGTNVNLAARLQSLAGAGEVAMGRDDAEQPAIARRLQGLRADVSSEALAIKGFTRPIEIVRVRPA